MFSWLPGASKEKTPLRDDPFKVSYEPSPGKSIPGRGTEISETGLVFLLDAAISGHEANLRLQLRQHDIPARVRIRKADVFGGHRRYRCEFEGIAADDWDRIIRYIRDEPDVEHHGSYVDPSKIDDDYRALPMSVQRQIVDDLVARHRLEQPHEGVAPLMRMQVLGRAKLRDGSTGTRISIHSRILVPGEEPKDADTRYLIDGSGNVFPM